MAAYDVFSLLLLRRKRTGGGGQTGEPKPGPQGSLEPVWVHQEPLPVEVILGYLVVFANAFSPSLLFSWCHPTYSQEGFPGTGTYPVTTPLP